MKAVIQTASFLNDCRKCGLSEQQQNEIVSAIAADPTIGDVIAGTGGCIKRRFAGRGKGKSGGYRTIHYNGADDVPVLLMVLLDKGERDNIDDDEKNEMKKLMLTYEKAYRASVAAKTKKGQEGA